MVPEKCTSVLLILLRAMFLTVPMLNRGALSFMRQWCLLSLPFAQYGTHLSIEERVLTIKNTKDIESVPEYAKVTLMSLLFALIRYYSSVQT